jgi:predicted  nucleic acid-binding Zn-ribbon protein
MPKDNKEKIPGEDVLEVLQNFIQLSSERFDKTEERFDRIEKNMATKKDIEGVNARIDTVEKNLSARIDKVEGGLKDVKDELVSLGHKTERLERKMETIANALEERMGEQEKELRRVKVKAGMIA